MAEADELGTPSCFEEPRAIVDRLAENDQFEDALEVAAARTALLKSPIRITLPTHC